MHKVARTAFVAAALVAALPAAQAQAATLVVDVTGSESFFNFGDPANTVLTFNIGAGARITDVAYDVTITAFDPSWLSEATLAFTGSDAFGDGVFLTPGFAENDPGTMSYADSADLVALGLDFAVGADGILRLEFFESFDDSDVNPDSIWERGTVTFTYTPGDTVIPEPATWAMMIGGFGMAGAAMRRRRKVRVTYA